MITLKKVGEKIVYQDNRATDQPLFIVQEQVQDWGIDPDYSYDGFVWYDNYEGEALDESAKPTSSNEVEDPPRYEKRYFSNRWEFVTACFTERGCKDYINANKHNHQGKLRIYAEGSFRNEEYRSVRNKLIEIAKGYENGFFVDSFNLLADQIHQTAIEKGWWDKERNDGESIALIHSELSEALEALREGNPPDDKIPEFSGAEAELADVIIRIMDLALARGWRVAEAIKAKIEFNKTRERMHGGKEF